MNFATLAFSEEDLGIAILAILLLRARLEDGCSRSVSFARERPVVLIRSIDRDSEKMEM